MNRRTFTTRGIGAAPLLGALLGVAPGTALASPPEHPEAPEHHPEHEPLAEEPTEPELGRYDRRRLKFDLGEKDPVTLELGASYWVRGQMDQQEGTPDWAVPQRVRAQVGARYRIVSAFVQLQDVREWGSASSDRATDPYTGLHQGFMTLGEDKGKRQLYTRIGRQEHVLGALRLIGNAPWNPNMRALDGAKLHGEWNGYGFDVFGAIVSFPKEIQYELGGAEANLETQGEYLVTAQAFARPLDALSVEAYGIVSTYQETANDLDRDRVLITPGARVSGEPIKGLEYDVEAYGQFGAYDGAVHRAWAGAATVTYHFDLDAWKPGLEASYAIASGEHCEAASIDDECGAGTHTEFDGLYGARHRFLGIADLFAFSNVRDLQLGTDTRVGKWLWIRSSYHLFQLHEEDGRWIDTGDRLVGNGFLPGNDTHTVGHEVDLRLTFTPWWPLKIEPGYAIFIPTGAGNEIMGTSNPYHLAYLNLQAKF